MPSGSIIAGGSSQIPTDWERCAQAELWLSHGRGLSPKTDYVCGRGQLAHDWMAS